MPRKAGVARTSTVRRLGNRVRLMAMRMREMEENLGAAQASIAQLHRGFSAMVDVSARRFQEVEDLQLAEEVII